MGLGLPENAGGFSDLGAFGFGVQGFRIYGVRGLRF